MKLVFPSNIFFGTSTSAYQIETAFQHDWQGLKAKDGYTFDRTTDHEKRFLDDVDIISSLAPNYRMSLMWSKLQRAPFGNLDRETVSEYHTLLKALSERNVKIMMVLHHWGNPNWFVASGGWENEQSVAIFLDFSKKLICEFGEYVTYWNTFNEPNLYTTFGYLVGKFPPYKRSLSSALKVIRNIGKAHNEIYSYIKSIDDSSMVGLSHNCVSFTHDNILGMVPASLAKFWYMGIMQTHFSLFDYIGISYYARLSFDPMPVTYLERPQKFVNGRVHDLIWEYFPNGLELIIRSYWDKFHKPIIITENGVCTKNDNFRIQSLKDYMIIIHRLLQDKVDLRGYYHWSAWDNFEWTLGPTFKFGLYECDPDTMIRRKKPSADIFSRLSYKSEITV